MNFRGIGNRKNRFKTNAKLPDLVYILIVFFGGMRKGGDRHQVGLVKIFPVVMNFYPVAEKLERNVFPALPAFLRA